MHPDYEGYVLSKRKIHSRAAWHDIKFLLRKLCDVPLDRIYCKRVDYNDWCGWVVEFAVAVDLAELQRNVHGVVILGDQAVFIGVNDG